MKKPLGVLPCFDPKGFIILTPHTQIYTRAESETVVEVL